MKYRERFNACLTNPSEEDIFERDPVCAFSFFLSGRVAVLCGFADEILENLEVSFGSKVIDRSRIERAESFMWLLAHMKLSAQCTRQSMFQRSCGGMRAEGEADRERLEYAVYA